MQEFNEIKVQKTFNGMLTTNLAALGEHAGPLGNGTKTGDRKF